METVIKKYKNYEDYLDSLIIEEDQRYLQDIEIARQIVKLGYRFRVKENILLFSKIFYLLRSSGKTLSYDEFWQMKEELAISQGYGFGRRKSKIESNEDEIESDRTETTVDLETSSLHSAVTTFIQERYRHIVDNTINSVLFIIKKHDNGVEVSGHIDLNQRFADDPNFQKYLKGSRQINPQPGDLTYHHWTKGKTLLSNSDNWEILTESGKAEIRNKHSGDVVSMDILQSSQKPEVVDVLKNKRRGKSDIRKSSTRWTELETEPDAGLRIMYWDICLFR